MGRWFSWSWAFEDLDQNWTCQECVLDFMRAQMGTFLEEQGKASGSGHQAFHFGNLE